MDIVLVFFIYSILGWAVESAYCSVLSKRWINRGFLNGPFCPVYACGALAVVFLLPYQSILTNNIFILFIFGVFVTSLVEYVTGFLLETIFKTKWWDYSRYKFNIKGRVCLKNSLLFGFLVVILIKYIHPLIMELVFVIPTIAKVTFVTFFVITFAWDITMTVRAIMRIKGKTFELEKFRLEIMEKWDTKMGELESMLVDKLDLEKIKEKSSQKQAEIYQLLSEKIKSFSQTSGRIEKRLIKAFPDMKTHRYKVAFEELKKAILKR